MGDTRGNFGTIACACVGEACRHAPFLSVPRRLVRRPREAANNNSVAALENDPRQHPARATFDTVPTMNACFRDGLNTGVFCFWVIEKRLPFCHSNVAVCYCFEG